MDYSSYQRLSLLIKACYRNNAVMASATKITAENLRTVGATYVQAAVFGRLHQHWLTYKTLYPESLFRADMEAQHQQLLQIMGPQAPAHQQELVSLVTYMLPGFVELVDARPFVDMLNEIYKTTVGNSVLMQATNEAVLSGNYGTLIKQANEVNAASGTMREPLDILSKKNARPASVVPSGVAFLDAMLGGGFRGGNAYGILAPSGGGKTTLAAQISTCMAVQGRKVALVCTEQSADEPEFIDRFWSLVTGKQTSLFEPFPDEEQFPPELVSDADRQLSQIVRSNILFFDFSKNPGNMAEIRAIAGGLSGAKPDIILIDWAGQFAKQLIQNKDPLADNETNALKHIADECALVSREYAVPVVIFHQLRPDCSNPMVQYDHTDANMCKQFFFNLSYGIVIHPRDDNNILVVRTTKGRWLGRSDQMAILRGELSRFEGVSGYRRGKGKWVRESDLQKMPSERPEKQQKDLAQWMSG